MGRIGGDGQIGVRITHLLQQLGLDYWIRGGGGVWVSGWVRGLGHCGVGAGGLGGGLGVGGGSLAGLPFLGNNEGRSPEWHRSENQAPFMGCQGRAPCPLVELLQGPQLFIRPPEGPGTFWRCSEVHAPCGATEGPCATTK